MTDNRPEQPIDDPNFDKQDARETEIELCELSITDIVAVIRSVSDDDFDPDDYEPEDRFAYEAAALRRASEKTWKHRGPGLGHSVWMAENEMIAKWLSKHVRLVPTACRPITVDAWIGDDGVARPTEVE